MNWSQGCRRASLKLNSVKLLRRVTLDQTRKSPFLHKPKQNTTWLSGHGGAEVGLEDFSGLFQP